MRICAFTLRRSIPGLATPAATLALSAFIIGCGDSSGPPGGGNPTVASVTIEGAANTIEVNQQVQLTATARDQDGNVIPGQTFVWTSTNDAVASVSNSGLVTGQTVGQATINATTGGKSGSFAITVNAPTIPTITGVSPTPLVPGQSATITGQNFSPIPNNNQVTIGGAAVNVTQASASSLTVTVPSTLCVPGVAEVKVTVGGRSSNVIQQPAQEAGTAVNVAVGQQTILSNPTEFCLAFAASGATEAYLVGVQSTSESASSLTNIVVGGAASTSSPAFSAMPLREPAPAVVGPAQLPKIDDARRAERWRRHRMAEIAFRRAERTRFRASDFEAARAVMRGQALPAGVAASAIPAVVNVGDVIPIRVPNRNASICQNYIEISTIVRAVGTRGVWLEDQGNPPNGFVAADWQKLSSDWDTHIYPSDTEYFGNPSDLDQNGRIVIVVTKEVNKFGILGFATNADAQPRSVCPSSDFGEIFYARAPDPTGIHGDAYSRTDALSDAAILLAHEFTHIIQFARRMANNAPVPSAWELEGQATLAEEIIGHRMTNRQPGQNYGFDVAFTGASQNAIPSETAWYAGGFIDLALFYGFNADCPQNDTVCLDTRLAGAPEQCTWLENNNAGPCYDGREVYGVPWSLFRWLSDTYGAAMPGGESQLHRNLIESTQVGFANVANVVGQPIDVLLAQWAAALYVDDRGVANLDPKLTFSSWNMKAIADRLRQTAQLVPYNVGFENFVKPVSVRGGSTAYFRLSGAGRPRTSVRIRASNESVLPGFMRVWIVRLE